MEDIALIVILLLGGLALILAEVCTPSFGLLAAAAVACFGFMLYKGYALNSWFGLALTLVLIIGLPIYLSVMVRLFPKTPLGRRLTLRSVGDLTGSGVPQSKELTSLLGAEGKALTALRPSGTVEIGEGRFSASAESDLIQAGASVRVVKISGMTLIVRAAR